METLDLGKSVVIKGRLAASGDLTIEGQFEGTIEVQDHTLTVGRHGQIEAPILARVATIAGAVRGNVTATEKVEILATGSLHGDIVAPLVAIAAGAYFCGAVAMQPRNREEVRVSRSNPAGVPSLATGARRDETAKTA